MDSENNNESGFPKQGGDAIEIGDEFDDSEEEGDDPMPDTQNQDAMRKPMKANMAAAAGSSGKAADVKGNKVEDQPFDLAVDVNDSEEIDSDEEEDEVNVDVDSNAQAKNAQKQAQAAQQQM